MKMNQDVSSLIKSLKKHYPNASCSLDHKTPLQLIVATILSAQCTDERVNKVTPSLFKKYPTPEAYARSSPLDLEKAIHSTGFYRNKAKSLRGMAAVLVEKFEGKVPKKMDDLVALPGVARKTANVVLGNAYGIADGVVVDTHVSRLSARLGLSDQKTPEKIEKDLMAKVPKSDWVWFSHAIILHGRQVCKARAPQCDTCSLRPHCPNSER